MRDVVRRAWLGFAGPLSDGAPSIDEKALRRRYGAYEAWPADAELGLVVLGWALGPGFSIPEFRQSMEPLVPDFARAARAIGRGGSPTFITIGGACRTALSNGAVVLRWNLPPDVLYWPMDLSSSIGATVLK